VKPIVCYVTGRKSLGEADSTEILLARIRAAAEAGVDWVQIREREMGARSLLELAKAAIAACAGLARVLINDRLDVALAAGAAGVHLRGESAPSREVIPWLRAGNAPTEFLVGVSCHSLADARQAEEAGASYLFFGPVFETPAKKQFGAPQGLEKLAEVCRAARIPVIAIGGMSGDRSFECLRAGAAGIAAIRMFQEAREPAALQAAVAEIHTRKNLSA
jgi:thiamine-phosphate pyrophosphorylase